MTNPDANPQSVFPVDAINPASPMPLYYQLYENLSQKIQSGEIPNGFKLPSENTLASHLGVSRITVKRALNELASSGLVSRKRGSGTQVTLNTALMIKGGLMDMTSNISAIRNRTKAKLVERRQSDISESIYNKLNLSADIAVERTAHTLILNESPVTLSLTYAAANVLKAFTDAEIEAESLITLFRRQGIRVTKADQILSAVAATEYYADILSVPVGSPLMEIQCLMFDQHGKPCQFVKSYFRPDFYRYEMTLT